MTRFYATSIPTRLARLKSRLTFAQALSFMRRHRDRIAGGTEQVLASIVSMVGLIFLSRLMSIDDFGILAIAMGIWLVMEMVQHSSVLSPFIMSCPSPRDDPHEFGAWLAFNLALAMLVPLLLLVAGFILLPFVPEFATGMMYAAPLTFVGMLFMFARRVHYHRRDRKSLIIQTLSYGLSYILALLVVVVNVDLVTPFWGVLIITIAYGVPAILFTITIAADARFDRNMWHRIRREHQLIFQLGAAGSVWQLSYVAALVILSVLSTPAAVAIFSITRTMVRPITIMISTLLAVDFSKAVRAYDLQGSRGLKKVISEIWLASVLLTSIPMALLLLFPEFFLSLVYSEKYAHATFELQLRVLLFLPMIYGTPLDMGLSILRDTKFLMRTHMISLLIGIAILLGSWFPGQINATSALASLVISRLITLPMLHQRYRKLMASAQSTSPRAARGTRRNPAPPRTRNAGPLSASPATSLTGGHKDA